MLVAGLISISAAMGSTTVGHAVTIVPSDKFKVVIPAETAARRNDLPTLSGIIGQPVEGSIQQPFVQRLRQLIFSFFND